MAEDVFVSSEELTMGQEDDKTAFQKEEKPPA
jgi:hypothetical protein